MTSSELPDSVSVASFKIDITPSKPLALTGFGTRHGHRETLGPKNSFLRMLWIKDIHGNSTIIFSADLLYFPDALADELSTYLHKAFSISRDSIIFSATHTHSGPTFGYFKSDDTNEDYFKDIFNRARAEIEQSSENFKLRSMRAVAHLDDTYLAIHRRKKVRNPRSFFLKHFTTTLPNTQKSTPQPLCLMGFYNEADILSDLVISFGCHPVFNVSEEHSSDFPGAVIDALKNSFPDTLCLFLQGFGGDLRPNFTTRFPQFRWPIAETLHDILKVFSFGEIFKTYTKRDFDIFVRSLVTLIQSSAKRMSETDKLHKIEISQNAACIDLPSVTKKTTKSLYIKQIKFCRELKCVAISAEVHSGYYRMIAQSLGSVTVPIATTDRVIGYLPLADEISDGGYEVVKSAQNVGLDGPFDTAAVRALEKFIANNFGS